MQSFVCDIYNTKGVKVADLAVEYDYDSNLERNKILLAQAMRVHLANKRQGTVANKSRGDVVGSTRKIYRQKGTGRARHGDIKAPIFVGGGVTFSLKEKNKVAKLNKKMRNKAFGFSLIDKIKEKHLLIIDSFGSLTGKTKEFATILKQLPIELINQKSLLLITDKNPSLKQAARNINKLDLSPIDTLNTYEVLTHKTLIAEKKIADKLFEKADIKVKTKDSVKTPVVKKTVKKTKKTI